MLGCIAIDAQQLLVEFADRLQSLLHLAVLLQSLAHLGNLFRAEAELAGVAAGVVDIEDPERMALAAGALGTTAGMTKGALEQGATQDVAEMREAAGEPVAFLGGLLVCHLYR